jgi:2-amino-4-hydroxy-6-hydroxymethyldihydropteridine diphosphokinase
MSHRQQAHISVGSNLGNPLENCQRGIDALCDGVDVILEATSPFYRTEPVDFTDQDWFVNAAIKVSTTLRPQKLLDRMQTIQREFGRKQDAVRFGPRFLDLDIIFFQELVVDLPELTIPHPRAHKRRFVLQPICDIDPTIVHPVLGIDVQTILNQLVTDGQRISPCSSGC